MSRRMGNGLALLACIGLSLAGCRELVMPEAFLEPEEAGPDYAVQGEYAARGAPIGVQVIALGGGSFLGVFYSGGLPGTGFDGEQRIERSGRSEGTAVEFEGDPPARIENGSLLVSPAEGPAFTLARVERESPTLGRRAPPGAIVVFDGTGTENVDGRMDERGYLQAGATSHAKFHDATVHLEFRTPFEPEGEAQFRGNSGVYLQNRYEVQILDSFGLAPADDLCGGIYEVSAPSLNMALPPLRWQTYDIDFTAARFDDDGRKRSPARITVRLNGIVIQDDVEIPDRTGLGDEESSEPGPLYLQDHWNPVVFRNVWILPTGGADPMA